MKLTPAASIVTSASPRFGDGRATSSSARTSGPPVAWTRIAFTRASYDVERTCLHRRGPRRAPPGDPRRAIRLDRPVLPRNDGRDARLDCDRLGHLRQVDDELRPLARTALHLE